jgi:hypothetical protein
LFEKNIILVFSNSNLGKQGTLVITAKQGTRGPVKLKFFQKIFLFPIHISPFIIQIETIMKNKMKIGGPTGPLLRRDKERLFSPL